MSTRQAKFNRRQRAARRAAGLCHCCGGPPLPGRSMCGPELARRREQYHARRAKAAAGRLAADDLAWLLRQLARQIERARKLGLPASAAAEERLQAARAEIQAARRHLESGSRAERE